MHLLTENLNQASDVFNAFEKPHYTAIYHMFSTFFFLIIADSIRKKFTESRKKEFYSEFCYIITFFSMYKLIVFIHMYGFQNI